MRCRSSHTSTCHHSAIFGRSRRLWAVLVELALFSATVNERQQQSKLQVFDISQQVLNQINWLISLHSRLPFSVLDLMIGKQIELLKGFIGRYVYLDAMIIETKMEKSAQKMKKLTFTRKMKKVPRTLQKSFSFSE